MSDSKPLFLLDTGPMISLCAFPSKARQAYIHTILNYATIGISEGIAKEILHDETYPGASLFKPLVQKQVVVSIAVPPQPEILDTAYGNKLGQGERDIIRVGLAHPNATTVIDDKDAFQIAARFGLKLLGLQDMIVKLVRDFAFPKATALEIVTTTASRYPAPFLVHTLFLLNEVK